MNEGAKTMYTTTAQCVTSVSNKTDRLKTVSKCGTDYLDYLISQSMSSKDFNALLFVAKYIQFSELR